jgi:hypothetical protein
MKLLAIGAAVLLFSIGCTPDLTMRHPETGQIAICHAPQWLPLERSMYDLTPCEDEYKAKGYERDQNAPGSPPDLSKKFRP